MSALETVNEAINSQLKAMTEDAALRFFDAAAAGSARAWDILSDSRKEIDLLVEARKVLEAGASKPKKNGRMDPPETVSYSDRTEMEDRIATCLSTSGRALRAGQIAEMLEEKKPSVAAALSRLARYKGTPIVRIAKGFYAFNSQEAAA